MSQDLPIFSVLPLVQEEFFHHNILILQAPPGAGKSTSLPIHLLNQEWLGGKKIIMREPRRLAARSVANRIAFLLNEETGKTVGYRIRFENKISSETKLEVVTEGVLTRMLQTDNSLSDVGLIIFDEFHERSLHADLALALACQAQQVLRPDLRILIMSATLDGNKLSALLNNAPIITCEGRPFPVKMNYLDTDDKTSLPLNVSRAIKMALTENTGDLLVFLPGAGEIHRTHELLQQEQVNAVIHPLFGDLPQQQQQLAIIPNAEGRRKIILSTSIAETSLTIEGISVVIDSGYSRVPRFDLRTGLTRLETVRVTRDSADQRAGRAGRLGPGVCYRLWNEGTHLHLKAHRDPEITDADLAPMLLELAQWGVKDPSELIWVTPPSTAAVKQAKELLEQLGATKNNSITSKGKEMLRLPTHPRMAHLMLDAQEADKKNGDKKYTGLASDLVALLEERDPLQKDAGADLTLRVEALRKWRNKEWVNADKSALERIERSASAWRRLVKIGTDNSIPAEEDTGKLLLAAYPERIAKQLNKNNSRYRLANGRIVKLPEGDPLIRQEWLSVAQLDAGNNNEGKIFLAAPVDLEDLMHLTESREVIEWDNEKGIIVAVMQTQIGNIPVKEIPLKKISDAQRSEVLCKTIRSLGLKSLLNWDESCDAWRSRVQCLRTWRPAEDWPDVNNEKLLDTLEEWLAPYLLTINKRDELKRLDARTILQALLPWELQQRLDKLAPANLKVPSGSMIPLNYFADGSPPEMAVRLQEVFGLHETPSVNEGRNKILMHLLSPARRPVQVTQDLRSFWERTYGEVRKELRLRYPKHSWPEDPWTAEAVRGVKRKT